VIAAYENYYKESEKALDAANEEIAETAQEAESIREGKEESPGFLDRLRGNDNE